MKNHLYAFFIDGVTNLCYGNCLEYFPRGSVILDVGIGNGIMIREHHALIREKGLRIEGIDLNEKYLAHCRELIGEYGLSDQIRVHHAAVEDLTPVNGSLFDYILFSMSFMLFRDQALVLDRVGPWLNPEGKVVFFQTMFRKRSWFMELVKPRLKYVTTIDFGRVTYEKDFFKLLRGRDLAVLEDRLLKREWFRGEYRLIVAGRENGARVSA